LIYRGDELVWRSFHPELLGATVLVMVELALMLAAMRAESLPKGGGPPVIVGLAVSASAIAAVTYAGSLAVVALALPLPTIAVAGAAFSGSGRTDARGLIGLAAADVIAIVGLSLIYARTGSIAVDAAGGAGPALLLAAAVIKSGAIPAVATWRLSAGPGPAAWLEGALRGQAVALAALAALVMRGGAPAVPMAIVAAAAIFVAGVFAHVSIRKVGLLAAVSGAGAALPFLALGLGGAVGTRAFLLLFPAVLLAGALVTALARDPEEEKPAGDGARAPSGPWAWLAACAIGVALASLLGMPPGGGFPGTWLTVSLAAARSEVTLAWLLATGGAAVGLALAFKSSITLIRGARAQATPAIVGAIGGLLLIYLGTQPIRIGLGWWIRIETALRLPEVLPTAGAPGLPAIGGLRLVLLLAPALVLVAAVVALGRGFVRGEWAFAVGTGFGRPRRLPAPIERLRRTFAPLAETFRPLREPVARLRSLGVGYGIAGVLELGALLLAGRIVLLTARAGFL
jgi:hypothetical protein